MAGSKSPAVTVPSFTQRYPYWSWVILAFASMNVIFLGGKRRAFGIFVAQLRVEFNDTISLAELNWIGDSYAAVGYLTTTLSSIAILRSGRRFRLFQFTGAVLVLIACITSAYVPNPHWLFITHTILHGIGSSLILTSIGLVVNEHFDKSHKYHILATTLVSGGSVASIVFVEVYAILIETYGWRQAFVILGAIYFIVIASAAFVFEKNEAVPDYTQNKCSMNCEGQITAEKGPLLVLWTCDRILTSVVTYGVLMNLTDYVRQRESSLTRSAVLTTLFAAGEASTYLIGAIVSAATQNFMKNRLKHILLVSSLCMSFSLVLWEYTAENKMASRFFAYLSGFCLGPSITFLFPAGEEVTTLPGHMAYPFSLAGMGLGMSMSPMLSAFIAQRFKYRWFFLVQGGLMFLKFLCLLSAIIWTRALKLDEKKTNEYRLLKDMEAGRKERLETMYADEFVDDIDLNHNSRNTSQRNI